MDGKISSKERAIEHVSNQPVKKQAPPQRPAGDLVKYITDTDLFKALDEPAIRYIETELEWVHLAQGEMLFQPGDYGDWETRFGLFQPGDCVDCMYVVVAGRLGVMIIHPDGGTEILNELTPGATVGEMGLFTGRRYTKGICALEDTDLVKLSKSGFDRLIEKFPQVMIHFSEIMTPRLRQIQLTSAFNNLFGSLGELALQHLEPELEWQRIYNGDILMRQGDDSDSMYIVISGRLNVVATQRDGSQRLLAEVGPGECIGELALLTGEPQAATVCGDGSPRCENRRDI
jgi:CRP-like cAMP-binding protein